MCSRGVSGSRHETPSHFKPQRHVLVTSQLRALLAAWLREDRRVGVQSPLSGPDQTQSRAVFSLEERLFLAGLRRRPTD